MPAVSVIIPVFNRERYLREALESVREQTRPAEEIIVVDDGSTDGSAEVARTFGGPVRVLAQENRGAGAARNAGIAVARGELIAFLDSDDLWLPGKLERQVAELEARPELDVVFCRMAPFVSPEIDAQDLPSFDLEETDACNVGACMARRGVFAQAGLFPTDLRAGEFVAWLGHAREIGLRSEIVPEVLFRRRIHHGNTMRQGRSRSDYLRLLKRQLDRRRTAAG